MPEKCRFNHAGYSVWRQHTRHLNMAEEMSRAKGSRRHSAADIIDDKVLPRTLLLNEAKIITPLLLWLNVNLLNIWIYQVFLFPVFWGLRCETWTVKIQLLVETFFEIISHLFTIAIQLAYKGTFCSLFFFFTIVA